MNCGDVRIRLLDYERERLPLPAQGEVRAHLDACADCARADAVEQELTWVLEHRGSGATASSSGATIRSCSSACGRWRTAS